MTPVVVAPVPIPSVAIGARGAAVRPARVLATALLVRAADGSPSRLAEGVVPRTTPRVVAPHAAEEIERSRRRRTNRTPRLRRAARDQQRREQQNEPSPNKHGNLLAKVRSDHRSPALIVQVARRRRKLGVLRAGFTRVVLRAHAAGASCRGLISRLSLTVSRRSCRISADEIRPSATGSYGLSVAAPGVRAARLGECPLHRRPGGRGPHPRTDTTCVRHAARTTLGK